MIVVCVEWKESFASVIQSESNSIPFQIGLLLQILPPISVLSGSYRVQWCTHIICCAYRDTWWHPLVKAKAVLFLQTLGEFFVRTKWEIYPSYSTPDILMQDFNPFNSTVLYYHICNVCHYIINTVLHVFSLFCRTVKFSFSNLSVMFFFFCIDVITSLEEQK